MRKKAMAIQFREKRTPQPVNSAEVRKRISPAPTSRLRDQRNELSHGCRLEVGDTAGWETCATWVTTNPESDDCGPGVFLEA